MIQLTGGLNQLEQLGGQHSGLDLDNAVLIGQDLLPADQVVAHTNGFERAVLLAVISRAPDRGDPPSRHRQ
ncbi:MAG TPA: hypothetical protein VFH49_14425, partial [Aquabacterium sp.]|nr:hypothetical protein [Aquabacterium sp.]